MHTFQLSFISPPIHSKFAHPTNPLLIPLHMRSYLLPVYGR